eukprot:TRINITY_DN9167_c0_g1_i1.p1 TRINITY_DN9167_c0_g1~~TRINITY_DN9167_c0_g1_i1.p1  ORF type:complete len:302 (-),score=46.68 TRINITY_DN9167_c0_g1_i1:105-947(-)
MELQTETRASFEDVFTYGKVLGRGSSSIVKTCTHKQTGKVFAVKVVNKSHFRSTKFTENEIEILRHAKDHPNIIKLVDVYDKPEQLLIVMELIKGGDLYSDLVSNWPFSEEKVVDLFTQILDAVSYLHSMRVTHRDLKLENILIDDRERLKITDFGLSKLTPSDMQMMETRCGTPNYAAPELVRAEMYDNRIDIWSLGIALYLLFYCRFPFVGESLEEVYTKIEEAKTLDFPVKSDVSSEAKDLISKILKSDPSHRLTLSEIRQHPWMLKFKIEGQGAID